MMPRMDGVQLCRCLRARPGAPYTYFILLTALGDSEHRIAGMQAGADDYLAKPFDLADIEARLIAAERVTVAHRRREALLRLARRFAAQDNPAQLLENLLSEAVELVGGSTGIVARWDDDDKALVALGASTPELNAQRLRLGEGASGRAAQQRAPVLLRRSQHGDPDPILAEAHLESAIAVPLLHEARLVGTLAIGSGSSDKVFTQQDTELLEMLASMAASALVAHEHARLGGVMLAARTAQHELNNQLAVARGYAEMLVASGELPAHLAEMAQEVKKAADEAATIVRQMSKISRIREHQWPDSRGSTINLARSQD
jgi:CheY-like chemotaxis protein